MSSPGIAVTVAAWLLIDFDKPDLELFKHFDWAGLAFMAVLLGTLEYVLEEGPSDDWLQDDLIFTLRHPAVGRGSGVLLAGPQRRRADRRSRVPSPTAISLPAAPSPWSWASGFMA